MIKYTVTMLMFFALLACSEKQKVEHKTSKADNKDVSMNSLQEEFKKSESKLNILYNETLEAMKFSLDNYPDSLKDVGKYFEDCVNEELSLFKKDFKKWKNTVNNLKADPFETEEYIEKKDKILRLKAKIQLYEKKTSELQARLDIYKGKARFKKYFPQLYTVRMLRIIPSLSDTSHILIVLDIGEDYRMRETVFLRMINDKIEKIFSSKETIVDRMSSGMMSDMLIGIYTDLDMFTLVFYHAGNWHHGQELTFGKKENAFVLVHGVGISAVDARYYKNLTFYTEKVYFFKQGVKFKDMVYGTTPEILYEYTLDNLQDAKKYFKYLDDEL